LTGEVLGVLIDAGGLIAEPFPPTKFAITDDVFALS
jgi:hypothetical protein